MKKRILWIIFTIISIVILKVYVIDRKIQFLPIDYKDVNKITINGFTNENSEDIDIKRLTESINSIKKYLVINFNVNHHQMPPLWDITLEMKDKQTIILYYQQGRPCISNRYKSYTISASVVKNIIDENNLKLSHDAYELIK